MLEEYLDIQKVKIIIMRYSYLFVIIQILVPWIHISNCFTDYNLLNSPILLPVVLGLAGAVLKT
jgi:hypothetical protein